MEIYSNVMIGWVVGSVALVAGVWAGLSPWLRWSIRSEAVVGMVKELVEKGDLERTFRLLDAAPRAPLVRMIRAYLEVGRSAAEKEREHFAAAHARQRVRLAAAGVMVALASALSIYLIIKGGAPYPLLIGTLVGAGFVALGWRSSVGASRACDRALESWLAEIYECATPELQARIEPR